MFLLYCLNTNLKFVEFIGLLNLINCLLLSNIAVLLLKILKLKEKRKNQIKKTILKEAKDSGLSLNEHNEKEFKNISISTMELLKRLGISYKAITRIYKNRTFNDGVLTRIDIMDKSLPLYFISFELFYTDYPQVIVKFKPYNVYNKKAKKIFPTRLKRKVLLDFSGNFVIEPIALTKENTRRLILSFQKDVILQIWYFWTSNSINVNGA